jgi:hypothetical protein
MISGFDSATAIAPIEPTGTFPSVIGTQVSPASVVGNPGHRGDPAASRRTDQPVAEAAQQRGIDLGGGFGGKDSQQDERAQNRGPDHG